MKKLALTLIGLTLVLLAVWGVWVFGLPFADRPCHRSQSAELDRLENAVLEVVPDAKTTRVDQCRDDADPQLVAAPPPSISMATLQRLFLEAGWTQDGTEMRSHDVHVTLARSGKTTDSTSPVQIIAQRVGYHGTDD